MAGDKQPEEQVDLALGPEAIPANRVKPAAWERVGRGILAVVREAVHRSGKQADDFAVELGRDPAQVSRALNDAGAHFSVTWLGAVIDRDRDHLIAKAIARLAGGDFIAWPDQLSPEEKVRRLEAKLREDFGRKGEEAIAEAYATHPPTGEEPQP